MPRIDNDVGCIIPDPGQWPVDPQEDQPVREDRLWIDGCFDFFHHGHAGVMLQSRRLGNELWVGLHSDEEIALNKGPTVMSLAEREAAVNACRFSTACVIHAPYVTSLPWIDHYGCQYVSHGDDITSDADGNDCYRFVKKAGRMKIVPRTPGISTTDLVGRMLLCTRDHFIQNLTDVLRGQEGSGTDEERVKRGQDMERRIREYAAAPNGKDIYIPVYIYGHDETWQDGEINGTNRENGSHASFQPRVSGLQPRPGQRIVYVDGGFDLFSSGHIAFLRTVTDLERQHAGARGWHSSDAVAQRIRDHGEDYPPAYVIAGIHDDITVNAHKGVNYPIMNLFERGLCVVQCAYTHAVIFNAPYIPSKTFLGSLPTSTPSKPMPDVVYHGPTASMPPQPGSADPYADAKAAGIFVETPAHAFQHVNAEEIVRRILDNRERYEERQRKKGMKGVGEEAHRRREMMEREAEERRARGLQAGGN